MPQKHGSISQKKCFLSPLQVPQWPWLAWVMPISTSAGSGLSGKVSVKQPEHFPRNSPWWKNIPTTYSEPLKQNFTWWSKKITPISLNGSKKKSEKDAGRSRAVCGWKQTATWFPENPWSVNSFTVKISLWMNSVMRCAICGSPMYSGIPLPCRRSSKSAVAITSLLRKSHGVKSINSPITHSAGAGSMDQKSLHISRRKIPTMRSALQNNGSMRKTISKKICSWMNLSAWPGSVTAEEDLPKNGFPATNVWRIGMVARKPVTEPLPGISIVSQNTWMNSRIGMANCIWKCIAAHWPRKRRSKKATVIANRLWRLWNSLRPAVIWTIIPQRSLQNRTAICSGISSMIFCPGLPSNWSMTVRWKNMPKRWKIVKQKWSVSQRNFLKSLRIVPP